MSEKRSNLITVGRIGGAFGIKGWVKVKSHTQPEDGIFSYQPWWLKTRHGVKPAEVAEYQHHAGGLIVRLEGFSDRNAAEALGSCDIAIEKDSLPELASDDFYWHQLVGLAVVSVYDGDRLKLGVVDSLMETGANDVLVVKPVAAGEGVLASIDERERLVPYVLGMYVKQVDLVGGEIIVDWDPEF